MKHVFSPSEVAHLFANQLQDYARNSGNNLYFNGDTIYSYGSHFAIAKHVKNANGEKGLLFTTRRYSNTTAKQISIVSGATSHLNKIYCNDPLRGHEENLYSWQRKVETIAESLIKAKKPAIYLNQIDSVKDEAMKYINFFSLSIPAGLGVALAITNKEQYIAYSGVKASIEKAAEYKKKKDLQQKHKKELQQWLQGKTSRLYNRNGYDYLRINFGRVETTQGVEIPFKTALSIFKKVKAGTLQEGDKILDYSVLSTGKEIKIGCHNFKTSYLLTFGEQLQQHTLKSVL